MFWVVKRLLLGTVVGLCLALAWNFFETEYHVLRWQERVESVESLEAMNLIILQAQIYSDDVLQMASQLAFANRELMERERQTTSYVVALEDENTRLKASLVEATTHLQDQVAENNNLHKELENANWRLKTLEETVKSLNEALRKVNEAQRDQSENGTTE